MAGKIKVLHIITRLDTGGSSDNTLLTVLGLDKARYEVCLVSGLSRNPSLLLNQAKLEGIRLLEIKNLIRPVSLFNDLIALAKIYTFIKKEKPRIVHTHTSKAGVLGRIAARLNGVPVVLHTGHGHNFYGYCGRFFSYLTLAIERIMARLADMIIALTEREKKDYLLYKLIPEDKITCIYSGIEIDKIKSRTADKAAKRRELGIAEGYFLVGCIGRLDRVKGQRYLLEAVPRVIDEVKNIKFILAGGGPLRKDLERLAICLKVGNAVVFLGQRYDCLEIISALDILVLPSLNEGMGRVLLEAQLLGVPVIASNVGGVAEVISDGKTGILVPPANPQALADNLISLLKDNRLRQKMSQEARSWVDRRFSAQAMVEKIDNLYQFLIKGKLSDG